MCWLMAYHEARITPERPLRYSPDPYDESCIWDGSHDYEINNLESIKKDYFYEGNLIEDENVNRYVSIETIQVKGKTFYTFKHGGCSCDFFQLGLNKLSEDFEYFIGYRMKIRSLEPCILTKWLNDGETIDDLPETITDIEEDKIRDIFKKGTNDLYCIKRKKQSEKYVEFVTGQRNYKIREMLYILNKVIRSKP